MTTQRPPLFTASRLQTATYLLGVCPFSIAFLVFLNSSVSFVVTDLIGLEKGEGDAVGSLGFADELLALIACPAWGLLSDKIGVRYVSYKPNIDCSSTDTDVYVIRSALSVTRSLPYHWFSSSKPPMSTHSSFSVAYFSALEAQLLRPW
jgi:hypothetical protein